MMKNHNHICSPQLNRQKKILSDQLGRYFLHDVKKIQRYKKKPAGIRIPNDSTCWCLIIIAQSKSFIMTGISRKRIKWPRALHT